MSTDYDIAIVGGGLVGTSLALALDQQGWRVALLERAPFRDTAPPTFDDRTLALSQASQNILDGIGLWSALERDRTAIRQVHVSQPGAPGVVNLVAEDYGLEALGHVVQARGIGREVKAALPQLKQVSLLVPAQVTAIETAESAVTVSYDHDGETRQLTCRLLIGADGTRSVVRRGLGLEARVHDYEQTAVIANVMPGVDHQGRAFERLTPSGPLAVLPHVERRVGIVWVAGTQEAEAVLALDDEAFLAGLQQRFGYRLGELTRPGERASYPITQLALDHPVAQRAVVIGNAAHTLHPVAAQGFHLGLRDVATLAHLLAR
ncbi:MAG: FAD-dependent oxidoreductase, partial [Pseudomonadota bacterium]